MSSGRWFSFKVSLSLRACLCLCCDFGYINRHLTERERLFFVYWKKCKKLFTLRKKKKLLSLVQCHLVSLSLSSCGESACEESKIIFGIKTEIRCDRIETIMRIDGDEEARRCGLRREWVGNKKTFIFPNEKRLSFIISFYEYLPREKKIIHCCRMNFIGNEINFK